jgi:hypothetical protein
MLRLLTVIFILAASVKRLADAAKEIAMFCKITREETISLYEETIVEYKKFISCLVASDHAHSVIDVARDTLAESRKFEDFCKSQGL